MVLIFFNIFHKISSELKYFINHIIVVLKRLHGPAQILASTD